MAEKILVTGANGQIGTVLCAELRKIYGKDQVLASDIKRASEKNEPYIFLDILNEQRLREVIDDHGITQVYHLAAILSANGEWNPMKTWNINLNGLLSILNLAKEHHIKKIFFPSTIAVFGNTTPKVNTAQHVPLLPETVYGISKVSGEMWCNYYYNRYGVDVRSLRYPGIISHQSIPAGGTTDYAVEIFHGIIKDNDYECFLDADTALPMMYIPDAIRATIELMEAPKEHIKVRTSYNLSAMSFTPAEIFEEIQKEYPDATIKYEPDFRQAIAEAWSSSIDDSEARNDWDWKHEYDLKALAEDMIRHIKPMYE
ncbi:MAG: NAD-dependent epimerase/dehydratase family protein [Saprospiraceae bacterium]|nr:NAD-dependent epimerase/dehydratase family protein [Saprospiraceae bacterium]